jgi:hypothetical protein
MPFQGKPPFFRRRAAPRRTLTALALKWLYAGGEMASKNIRMPINLWRLLIADHPYNADAGAAVIGGTGIAYRYDLFDVVVLDEAVDLLIEFFKLFFDVKHFQGAGKCFDFDHVQSFICRQCQS